MFVRPTCVIRSLVACLSNMESPAVSTARIIHAIHFTFLGHRGHRRHHIEFPVEAKLEPRSDECLETHAIYMIGQHAGEGAIQCAVVCNQNMKCR